MMSQHQNAFSQPGMRIAVGFLIEGKPADAIRAARESTGVNSVGPDNDTLLLIAVGLNDRTAVQALLAAGADPNIPIIQAPIASAAEVASPAVVADLLRAGADPNGRVGSESAIWRASLRNSFEIVEALLQHGAAIDTVNVDGDTPALAATQATKYRMALFLLQRGASPLAKSNDGTSIGEWAAEARVNPESEEGHAREQLYAELRRAGAM